jgi:hypothetical protein
MTTDTDADSLDDPRGDLEHALTEIHCLQAVLRELGETDLCFSYLASRLDEHYEDAHDAFSRIFKLDEYAENGEEQQ